MRKIVVFEDSIAEWEFVLNNLRRGNIDSNTISSRIFRFRDWMDFEESYLSDENKKEFLSEVTSIYLDHNMPYGPKGDVIFQKINSKGYTGNFYGTSIDSSQRSYIGENYIGKIGFGIHITKNLLGIIEREQNELIIR